MKVLVTGGGGFLGNAIVKRLVARGDEVRSFSRSYYRNLDALGVEQNQGDLGDRRAVELACKGIEIVFHAAAKPPPWGDYADYYRTNVVGTQNVIASCYKQNILKLVYTSTPSVVFNGNDLEGVDESIPYPTRYNAPYPETKALAEKKVYKASHNNLGTIILRPHEIWGPGDPHFVPRIIARANQMKRVGDGKNLIDTTYIDNAADAHVLAAERLGDNPALSGKKYFISQDEPVPAWDMINAILNAAGLDPIKGSIPYGAAWVTGAVLEFFYKIFHLSSEPPMTRFLAQALAKAHWFDISAAKKDLGYTPRVSTEEGLSRLENWLKNESLA